MLTTIKFVGLIVVTLLNSTTTPPAPPPGAQMIIGNFPATVPPHLRIIAYPRVSRLNPNNQWPVVGNYTLPNGTIYDYVFINLENITVTGPTEAFSDQRDAMPHLTCCCAPFNAGFNPDWGSPNTTPPAKRSAFVTLTSGTLTTVQEPTNAISTVVLITDNANITFTGVLGGQATKTLVIQAGADIVVANEPICVLNGTKCPSMGGNDFLNYFQMGNNTQGCTKTPSSGCPLTTSGCPTNGAAAAQHKAPTLTAKERAKLGTLGRLYVNVDCSNSTYP
jgi:hypothetical protein